MDRLELIATAKRIATTFGLDPALVCAVIEQESSWDTEAKRLEQGFYVRYVRPQKLASGMEAIGRSTSWGLMQVMGQTAREHGYNGNFDDLCLDPEMAIQVGCIVLKKKLERAKGDLTRGLLLWNGGGNKDYPGEVIARIAKYR